MKKYRNTIFALLLILILLFVGKIFIEIKKESRMSPLETAQSCIPKVAYPFLHLGIVFFHIHPELEIKVDGEKLTIPKNIGIDEKCAKHLHTHDETGKLHVEALVRKDYTLEDFFTVWGKDFSAYTITKMTVNGSPTDTYEKTILRDLDKIRIEYKSL